MDAEIDGDDVPLIAAILHEPDLPVLKELSCMPAVCGSAVDIRFARECHTHRSGVAAGNRIANDEYSWQCGIVFHISPSVRLRRYFGTLINKAFHVSGAIEGAQLVFERPEPYPLLGWPRLNIGHPSGILHGRDLLQILVLHQNFRLILGFSNRSIGGDRGGLQPSGRIHAIRFRLKSDREAGGPEYTPNSRMDSVDRRETS